MQNITSSSANVALNAAATKPRFETCQYTWDKVTNPVGGNIISRVANAALEVVKNLAKMVYNAAVWLPNKIHSLLYPNAANAAATPNDDEVFIEQDSVVVSLYDNQDQVEAESDVAQADIIEIEDQLAEPKAASRTWLKAAAVGTVLAGATVGGLVLANRYNVEVPYFGGNVPGAKQVDDFLTVTVPGHANDAAQAVKTSWNNFWMKSCDTATLDSFKAKDAFKNLACGQQASCKLEDLQTDFIAKAAAAANCKV